MDEEEIYRVFWLNFASLHNMNRNDVFLSFFLAKTSPTRIIEYDRDFYPFSLSLFLFFTTSSFAILSFPPSSFSSFTFDPLTHPPYSCRGIQRRISCFARMREPVRIDKRARVMQAEVEAKKYLEATYLLLIRSISIFSLALYAVYTTWMRKVSMLHRLFYVTTRYLPIASWIHTFLGKFRHISLPYRFRPLS